MLPLISALEKQSPVDLCEFDFSLVYTESSRPNLVAGEACQKKKPGVGVGGGGRNSERKILNVYIITCIPTNFLNKWMLMIMSFLLLKTLIIFKKYCSSQNFEL